MSTKLSLTRYLVIPTIGLAALLPAMPASADNASANAVYDLMQASTTAADPALILEKVYAKEATYLPGYKELGIEARDAVIKTIVGSQQHLRKGGGRIEIKFRVVSRKRFGNVYVDNGYMRTAIMAKKDAPEQITYAKFATVITKQQGGRWAFVTDADSDTPASNFDNAKAVAGLKYDH